MNLLTEYISSESVHSVNTKPRFVMKVQMLETDDTLEEIMPHLTKNIEKSRHLRQMRSTERVDRDYTGVVALYY